MKPQKLILCGWGPYREKQEVDFGKLSERGLFLITGATGAGKTTIFDAITYALYGNMSGEVREKNSVRSDFAGSDTPTYVELTMEHGGRKYHIYRNPEYLRPKKRRTGSEEMTKEKEKAILTMPEGEKIEGSSEVTRTMQKLLRLDYKQFKQLSMIAQGEFAKLLTATPAEKSRIFREIFDTDLYDKMAGELRSRSGRLYKQVMEYRHKMEEDVSLFVPEEEFEKEWNDLIGDGNYYYEGILAFLLKTKNSLKKEIETLQEKVEKAEKDAEELTITVTEGEQTKNLSEQLLALQKKQESLLLQKEEKEREERCLTSALQAKEVRKQEEKWQLAVRNKEEAEKKEEITKKELEMLGKREEEMRTFYSHTEQLALAYTKEDRKKELQKKQQEISAELEKQKEMLSDLQKKYLAAEEEEDKNKDAYERADKEYRHGIAGILALDLKEGSPCPVCGALSHPEKAVLSEHMPSEQEVEELKQLYEEKREVRVKLHGNTAACKEKTDALSMQEKELLEEITFFLENENKRDAFVKEYMREHDEKAFLEQKKEYEALVIMIREKEKLFKERHKEAECCLKKEAEEKSLFEEERGKFFVGNEAYMQAFLPEKELQKLTDSIADYREEMKNTALMITHYEKELSGRVLIDLETYREKLREKKEEKSSLQEVLEKKRHTFIDTDKVMNSLKEKQKKQEKLSAEYGMIKRLDDTASGNNRLRLVFEQYVLAAYFEEILKAANLRLKVMSTGRYELKRMETVGDGRSKDNLEMEVLDYYTGKYRSVKTLSGGESFKVSLALALGMSDVVQALSGGIRVEALFIDEGFGSLDSESLEQACLTLQSLVEKDRLIGIISHVPELAEKIRNRIRIEKTNAGSRIEVMIS